MAKVEYAAPIANVSGAFAPRCICRQKRFKAGGKTILGTKEIFHRCKRDYKRHPLTAAEQQTIRRFQQAETQRKLEMADPERRAYWQARLEAQLNKPEPGNKKIYYRLDTFIRAMLMKEKLSENNI